MLMQQPITGDDLDVRQRFQQLEGRVAHMYQDNKGYVTVGIGHLLASARDAQRLPFYIADTRPQTLASTDLVEHDWLRVKRAPRRLLPSGYRSYTSLVLTPFDINDLFRREIARFTDGLRRSFPEYDTYPRGAQLALLDIAYNVGSVSSTTFPNLTPAVKRRDWRTAADESHRDDHDIGKERNAYTRDLFLSAIQGDTAKRVIVP